MSIRTIPEEIKKTVKDRAVISTLFFAIIGFVIGLLLHNFSIPLIQGIVTVILVFVSYDVINRVTEGNIERIINYIEELLREDIIIKQQKRDFLASLVTINDSLDLIEWEKSLIPETQNEEQYKTTLKEHSDYLQACQEALQGLLKIQKYDSEGRPVFLLDVMAKAAAEKIEEKDKVSQVKIYEILVLYLRAWLVCSIRYNTNMLPIQWIDEKNYNIREKIIAALKYIKTNILKDKRAEEEMSQKAREVVDQYLNKLITGLSEIIKKNSNKIV